MIDYIEKINCETVITHISDMEFEEYFDIVIAGLGTAGAISAITGARVGKKILAVERFTAAGGTITVGGVGVYYFGGRGGIYEESDELQDSSSVRLIQSKYRNADHKKYILDRMLLSENVSVMYESVIIGIYADGGKIAGVRIFDGKDFRNIGLKMLIDATGEGDICDMAGCSMTIGREDDDSPMPYTIVKSYIKEGSLSKTNHDSSKVDQRDTEAFSESIIKSYAAFCESDELIIKLQSLPGLREGRLLVGEERVTFSDAIEGRLTGEPVIYAYADFDKHGHDIAFDSELFIKWHMLANLGALNVTVPIPKGALIAREYDNLLVSGRCLSVDHDCATLVRMMRDMQKLGEVSAQMASLAIDDGVPVRDISYPKLKALLEKTDCLCEENNKGIKYDHRIPDSDYIKEAVWLTDEEAITKALSTLSPGLAIWSAKLMGEKGAQILIKNLGSSDENIRKHSAIGLSAMNRGEGVKILREMVEKRDRTLLTDMRKNNKRHIAQALCGLAILEDAESIDIIKELVSDREEHSFYPVVKNHNVDYFITLSSAVAALLKIGEAHTEYKNEIVAFLQKELSDLKYTKEIINLDENSAEYIQAKEIYMHVAEV